MVAAVGMRRLARAVVLAGGIIEPGARRLTKSAQYAAPSRGRSWYLDGSVSLDIPSLLERHAAQYNLSARSSDYLYEAIRANTVDAANENHDAFLRGEMLRFDRKAGRPVYASYIGKPHHLNHKTDVAHDAVGIILDAHYNEDAPPLPSCPQCGLRTADRSNRDESGLHCKRCNRLVKDEFVEILLGVDAAKNPDFAAGVRAGHLRAGSMGCTCLFTTCNVCAHVATTKAEFCPHIARFKGQYFARRANNQTWSPITPNEIGRELAKRGHQFLATDFTSTRFDDGFEVRKGFESCGDVTFDEYSRVAQPADPKALQREVLQMQHIRSAAVRRRTPATPAAVPGVPSRVAAPVAHDSDVRIQAPPNEAVVIEPASDGVPGALGAPGGSDDMGTPSAPGAPGAPGAPQVPGAPGAEPPVDAPGGAAGGTPTENLQVRAPQRLSPAEMGIGAPRGAARQHGARMTSTRPSHPQAAPAASAAPRAAAASRSVPRTAPTTPAFPTYVGWTARIAGATADILNRERVVVASVPVPAGMDRTAALREGRRLTDSLLTKGLIDTVTAARGQIRAASVIDGAIETMQGNTDHEMFSGTSDGRATDMAEPRDEQASELPDERTTDMADPRDERPASTTDDALTDHDRGGSPPSGMSENEHPDNQEGRSSQPTSLLEGAEHDHEYRTAQLIAQGAPGMRVAHTQMPDVAWQVSRLIRGEDGFTVSAAFVEHPEHGRRRLSPEDMRSWLVLDHQAAPVIRTAETATVRRLQAYYEQRETAAAERVAAVEADVERRIAEAQKHAIEAYQRALRLAAHRLVVELEPSPLRLAIEASLTAARQVGTNAATGQPLAYQGLTSGMARYLASEAYRMGSREELDHLLARAASLHTAGTDYLLAAENDARGFVAPAIQVTAADVGQIDAVALHAAETRHALARGNFTIQPPPAGAGGAVGPGMGREAAIAQAVSFSAGHQLLGRFAPAR